MRSPEVRSQAQSRTGLEDWGVALECLDWDVYSCRSKGSHVEGRAQAEVWR